MPENNEIYSAPSWAPEHDLRWLETELNVQSTQFMIECLPSIHELFSRCWTGVPLKVLDVGTGSGAGANLLATLYAGRMLGFTIQVDALELTSYLAPYAKVKYPLINYMVADVLDLPAAPNWDIVLCSHTIEHVERPEKFLRHLQSLARSWVLIYAPYNEVDRIEGHLNTIDDTFIRRAGAQSQTIVTSPAWRAHEDSSACVIFTLPGRSPAAGSRENSGCQSNPEHTSAFHENQSRAGSPPFLRAIPSFTYAMELYRPYLESKMPTATFNSYVMDFIGKAEYPVRILGLGCASADWALGVARRQAPKCEVTVIDSNPDPLAETIELARQHGIDLRIQASDVNQYDVPPGHYDFIVCRSGLHSLTMLERVLDQVRRGLTEGGEFLVMGEWIGRNGFRIYPETEKIANELFAELPIRFRTNGYTGKVDEILPNVDRNTASSGAKRSEEILPLLFSIFRPVEYVAFDTLISLFFDPRYGHNYNLDDEYDRHVVQRITGIDVDYLRRGSLRPTGLFGRFMR